MLTHPPDGACCVPPSLCPQFILPDLRCHGDTAEKLPRKPGPHTVATAAADVIELMRHLTLFPRVIMGHSFGGKVVLR